MGLHSLGEGPVSESTFKSRVMTFEKALRRNSEWEKEYRKRLRARLGRAYYELGYHYFEEYALRSARREFRRCLAMGCRDRKVMKYLLLSWLPGSLVKRIKQLKRSL
jgi:hypothetical protein